MPTEKELSCIVDITKSYLPEEKVIELFIKLDEQIGKKSECQITQQFISALRNTVDKPPKPSPIWLWATFYGLVTFHMALVIGIILAFFVLPFTERWHTALPLMVFIWFFSTTAIDCKLTNLENTIRKRLGLRKIGGFVGHYVVKPIKKVRLRRLGA